MIETTIKYSMNTYKEDYYLTCNRCGSKSKRTISTCWNDWASVDVQNEKINKLEAIAREKEKCQDYVCTTCLKKALGKEEWNEVQIDTSELEELLTKRKEINRNAVLLSKKIKEEIGDRIIIYCDAEYVLEGVWVDFTDNVTYNLRKINQKKKWLLTDITSYTDDREALVITSMTLSGRKYKLIK